MKLKRKISISKKIIDKSEDNKEEKLDNENNIKNITNQE